MRQRRVPETRAGARMSHSFRRTHGSTGKSNHQQDTATTATLKAVSTVASQAALITALLYYFGWVRTQAFYQHFGVDTSLLAFTTTDYVLRSLNSAFPPLAILALVALLLLGFHRWVVVHAVSTPVSSLRGKAVTGFLSTAPVLGATLGAVVLVGLLFPTEIGRPLVRGLPVMLVSAVGILGYSDHLRLVRLTGLSRRQRNHHHNLETRIRAIVLVSVGLFGLLWGIALYAAGVGELNAMETVATLQDGPEAILYSSDRIALAGPGIRVDEIQQGGSKYRYLYSGLRLLVQTGGRYILIPVGWQKGRDKVFMIPGSDGVRLDVISR